MTYAQGGEITELIAPDLTGFKRALKYHGANHHRWQLVNSGEYVSARPEDCGLAEYVQVIADVVSRHRMGEAIWDIPTRKDDN